MDCSPPGSHLHGILQARMLEWVAISFSRGSSWTRDQTCGSWIGRQILYYWATREAQCTLGSFQINSLHSFPDGNPLQYSCLENPVDRGAWWAAVHRVAQSWTWLKWLSMQACKHSLFLALGSASGWAHIKTSTYPWSLSPACSPPRKPFPFPPWASANTFSHWHSTSNIFCHISAPRQVSPDR